MESVGKRNAKKKQCDDFIRYDLNTRRTKHNLKLSSCTKTDSKEIVRHKSIKGKFASKISVKNSASNCTLSKDHTEASLQLEDFSVRNEKRNGVHNTIADLKVVPVKIHTASIESNFHICKNRNGSNFACCVSASEKKTDINKNLNIWPSCSAKSFTSRHTNIRKDKSATYFRCVTCKNCFLWKKPYLDHLKIHKNELPFECRWCGKRFLSFFNYITHQKNFHSPGKAHRCHKCGKGYASWYFLKLHWIKNNTCPSRSRHLCNYFSKCLPYKHILSRHLVNEHIGTKEESSLSFNCKPCNKSFKDRRNLWIHQKRHPNAIKPYKCHFCLKRFALHKWLIAHVQRHMPERSYPCGVCSKSYFTKTDAAIHERRHTKEAAFPCSECGKKFIYRSELNAHIKRHLGIRLPKNIVCDICSKAFSTTRDLKRHLTVHTGEKPYKCNICSKCFSQEVNMQVHVKIHSGDRPHQCDLCDKKFLAKNKLARHRRCHATSKGMLPRPFKCVLCPKKYTAENSLIRHLRTHKNSVEIGANIKSALKKASEEFSTAQSPTHTGSVLACMIDHAILDARRMSSISKTQRATGDPSLAEIIDQAIHDSKPSSITPTEIENHDKAYISNQHTALSSSRNSEFSIGTEKETNISESFTDLSTHPCSDLIKLISDVLSKHTATNGQVLPNKSILCLNSSIENPSAQTVVFKPEGTVFKPDQIAWISKNDNHNALLTEQEMITSSPQRSLHEPFAASSDTTSAMNISPGVSDSQHISVDNLNVTTDVNSFQNKFHLVPINDLNSIRQEQIIFLDTLSDMLHPPPSGSCNSYQQQNILSINGQNTLVMVQSSAGKDLRTVSLQSSDNCIQQFMLPSDATSLTKKDQFILLPTSASRKSQSTSLKSVSLRKMEHSTGNNSRKHFIMISSHNESSCLPITITNFLGVEEVP